MCSFDQIYATACLHKGGEANVERLLPKPLPPETLKQRLDNEYLEMMSLRIFRAGLKHEMVDKKWPDFLRVFRGFDPFFCAMLSDEQIEELMQDKTIIRHLGKIKSVRHNGEFVRRLSQEYGGFGRFLAQWPDDDPVGLWLLLKKQGAQLGGNSGPYFLRMVGKDTFLLTGDVIQRLTLEGVLDGKATSQKALKAAQAMFLKWKKETGRSMSELSRIVSYTISAE